MLSYGKEKDSEIVGIFRLETLNKHGEKWVQWYMANDLVANTWF